MFLVLPLFFSSFTFTFCLCVCAPSACSILRDQKGFGAYGTEGTGGCEHSCGCRESNLGPLLEH